MCVRARFREKPDGTFKLYKRHKLTRIFFLDITCGVLSDTLH